MPIELSPTRFTPPTSDRLTFEEFGGRKFTTSSGLKSSENPVVPYVQQNYPMFQFNQNFIIKLEKLCSYEAYREKYFKFPPPGP
jgi:hypothetical protein